MRAEKSAALNVLSQVLGKTVTVKEKKAKSAKRDDAKARPFTR